MKTRLLALSALVLPACVIIIDDPGDGGNKTDCSFPEQLSGPITHDEVLYEGWCYSVTRDLVVEGNLTIEPGAELVFGSGVWLRVQNGGSLTAVGTPQKKIVFRGAVDIAGHWGGIAIATNDPQNQLVHVEVANGGSKDFFYSGEAANVVVAGGRVEITDSLLRSSGKHGVYVRENDQVTLARNFYESNADAPVHIFARHIGMLDSQSVYRAMPGSENGRLYVQVRGSDVTTRQTWPALDVPYRVTNSDVKVRSEITVAQGAEFEFESGLWLSVHKNGGVFKAVGTEQDPIVFRGTTAVEGHWGGIAIESDSPDNELTYVHVLHGGSRSWFYSEERANIVLVGDSIARLKLTHSVVSTSGSHGLFARSQSQLPGFAGNVFENNEFAPLRVPVRLLGSLDKATDYRGPSGQENLNDWVEAYGGGSNAVTSNQTWRSLNLPYRIVGGNAEVDAVLTIEAGAELEFASGLGMRVNKEGGVLQAEGTASSPIYFTGSTEAAGHWKGIAIYSNDTRNVISNAVIGFGGSGAWFYSSERGNVFVDKSGTLKLTESYIHDSSSYGLVAYEESNLLSPHPTSGAANNIFTNNAGGSFLEL